MENENIPVFYVIVYRQSNTATDKYENYFKNYMKTVKQNIFLHVRKKTYICLL